MADYILKSGPNLLKSGNFILTSSTTLPTPDWEIDFTNLTGYVTGQKVPSFYDVTGRNLFYQPDPAKQATYLENALNGKPGLRFSGGQVYNATIGTMARTVFCVAKVEAGSPPGTLFAGTAGYDGYFFMGATSWFESSALYFGLASNKNRLFVNGSNVGLKTNGLRNPFFNLLSLDVADDLHLPVNLIRIGAAKEENPYFFPFTGDVCNITAYAQRLTEINRQTKEAELLNTYWP